MDPARFARFGDYSEIVDPVLSIVHPGGISIGDWVKIGAYAVIEALAGEDEVQVEIDDGAYVGNFLRLSAMRHVRIGREAMLSDRVYLSDTGHVYEDTTRSIKEQGLREGRSVVIDDGAWVGIGAVIVGRVHIGRNAVVAANSVVRGDVPDFAVVAGDPATVIRFHDGDDWRWVAPRPAPPPA